MGFNAPASGESTHIAFFGLRNAGKSSLVNAITGQKLSIISDIKGTTTDPVKKAMELLPLGPVVIIDTPGIDDEGDLGELRIKSAVKTLDKTDIAVLVTDASLKFDREEENLLSLFKEKKIPYIIAYNKSDLLETLPSADKNGIYVSAINGTNINELKEKLASLIKSNSTEKHIVSDLLNRGDMVVLIVPIDSSAPKGRLILPQQQTIRDIIEAGAFCVVTKDTEYKETLEKLVTLPKLVITDSQVFDKASKDTPDGVLLTSFSILFARYKGDLKTLVKGANKLDELNDGDKILISEGCTHHRQCGDIGTVKLPKLIRKHTGKDFNFEFTSGGEFPDDLTGFSLVIHCGGCMLNEAEMKSRINKAISQNIPITNYGMSIAKIHGILERSLSPFPDILKD